MKPLIPLAPTLAVVACLALRGAGAQEAVAGPRPAPETTATLQHLSARLDAERVEDTGRFLFRLTNYMNRVDPGFTLAVYEGYFDTDPSLHVFGEAADFGAMRRLWAVADEDPEFQEFGADFELLQEARFTLLRATGTGAPGRAEGRRKPVLSMRTARVRPGSFADAWAAANALADHANAAFEAGHVRVCRAELGELDTITWFAEYEDAATWERAREAHLSDPAYVALYDDAMRHTCEGTLREQLLKLAFQ